MRSWAWLSRRRTRCGEPALHRQPPRASAFSTGGCAVTCDARPVSKEGQWTYARNAANDMPKRCGVFSTQTELSFPAVQPRMPGTGPQRKDTPHGRCGFGMPPERTGPSLYSAGSGVLKSIAPADCPAELQNSHSWE